jgi:hypothetical protein
MLWKPEEDELLKAVKNKEDPGFKLLLKIKNVDSLKKRIKYLKIDFPF